MFYNSRDMKKRFFLLALLASLSLSGCDFFSNLFPGKENQEQQKQKEEDEKKEEKVNVESIVIENKEIELKVGDYYKIEYTILPEEANQSVEYESSDEDCAIVYQDGKIYGVGVGDLKVRLTSSENHEVYDEVDVSVIDDQDPPPTPPTPDPSEDEEVKEYYKNISTTATGNTLKTQLYNLIKDHTQCAYGSLEVQMKVTDRDYDLDPVTENEPENYDPYMKLLYADYNGNKSTAKKWSTSQGSYGVQSGYVWNKEHIWAKSNGFGKSSGCKAYSDLHHLRASDWKCNNTRGNFPFSNVTNHTTSNASFDYTQNRRTDNYLENGVFEPRDSDKGDVARALFYMATRYMISSADSGNTALALTNGTDKSGGKWGYLSTLLAWNTQDPPDKFEINRNGLVQSFQHNRNPYIDHPEWAQKVFG